MEWTRLTLAKAFASRGFRVDLVVDRLEGAYVDRIPDILRVVALPHHSRIKARYLIGKTASGYRRQLMRPLLLNPKLGQKLAHLPGLVSYLRSRSPDALVTGYSPSNLCALWARGLAEASTRMVITEHNMLSKKITAKADTPKARLWRDLPPLIRRIYPLANARVAVSDGVAEDLAATTGLPRSSVTTIYNPVVAPDAAELAAVAPPHPWLASSSEVPVVVAAGRLVPQKDFALLLRAFAHLRTQRPARLLILGEGPERSALEGLVKELGLGEGVALPGFWANPYAAFTRASLFVLSSAFEGLPRVLIEALACGCPVVSTDCPSGPAEILAGGAYGSLVPVGDAEALAQAMVRTLDDPLPTDVLRRRAADFGVERAADRYLELLGLGSEVSEV